MLSLATATADPLLLAAIAALMIAVVAHDLHAMLVPALPVLALAALAILHGQIHPLAGLPRSAGLAGAGLALALGLATRLYVRLRTGVAAFGGADILLLAGAGGMLGPFLLGPWVLGAAALAMALSAAPRTRFQTRSEAIDGTRLRVLPFCPALIASWAGVYAAARAGLIPASF